MQHRADRAHQLFAFKQRETEQLLPQILEGGAEGVEPLAIDEQEAVVDGGDFARGDGRILGVVALQVQLQAGRDFVHADGGGHIRRPLVKKRQHAVVHVVVNQHNR